MSQPAEKLPFFNKLARFVANPTTDWKALDTLPAADAAGATAGAEEITAEELAQLHRQRRRYNCKVREREFNALRQLRSGGTEAAQPGADLNSTLLLRPSSSGAASALMTDTPESSNFDVSQINSIEQQMTDQWWNKNGPLSVPPPDSTLKTQIMIEDKVDLLPDLALGDASVVPFETVDMPEGSQPATFARKPAAPDAFHSIQGTSNPEGSGASIDSELAPNTRPGLIQSIPSMDLGVPLIDELVPVGDSRMDEVASDSRFDEDLQALPLEDLAGGEPRAITRVDALSDTLNEPAILFSQGQDGAAETRLRDLVAQLPQGQGATSAIADEEPDALLALLDLYRATAQEEKFDATCLELVQRFGRSAPQYAGDDPWLSQIGGTTSFMGVTRIAQELSGHACWKAPATIDVPDLLSLQQVLAADADALIDWRGLQALTPMALPVLLVVLRELAGRRMRLVMWGLPQLVQHLEQGCAAADRTTQSLSWMLRLELLRITGAQEAFDAQALDYCIALEESPPSWTPARCTYVDADAIDWQMAGAAPAPTASPASSLPPQGVSKGQLAHPFEWKGAFTGSIQPLLQVLQESVGSQGCTIDCSALERMDYAAAAELLAWLLVRKPEDGAIRFIQVQRLVAVFWRIMGITGQAQVELRRD